MQNKDNKEFFTRLLAGKQPVNEYQNKAKNHESHKKDIRLYHGPIVIPEDVKVAISQSSVYRTGNSSLAQKIVDTEGVTWLFKCEIPSHRVMVGEVMKTPDKRYRVHGWKAADESRAPSHDARYFIHQNRDWVQAMDQAGDAAR